MAEKWDLRPLPALAASPPDLSLAPTFCRSAVELKRIVTSGETRSQEASRLLTASRKNSN